MAMELTLEQKRTVLIKMGFPEKTAEKMAESEIDEVIGEVEDEDIRGFLGQAIMQEPAPAPSAQIIPEQEIAKAQEAIKKKGRPPKAKTEPEPQTPEPPAPEPEPTPIKPTRANGELRLITVKPEIDFESAIPKETDEDMKDYIETPEVTKALDSFRKMRQSIIMVGEAGTGKSTTAKWYAMKNKLPFLPISVDALLSVRELFGSLHIVGGTSFFVEGKFVGFCERQKGAVILIDEVTALDPARNFVFHQILAQRMFFVKDNSQEYRVKDDVMIMFAGNPPNMKYTGLTKFNLAFQDRLGTIELPAFTRDRLTKWVKEKTKLSIGDTKIILDYYDTIRNEITNENLRAEFTFRSLKRIIALRQYGYGLREAVDLGFLNGIKMFEPKAYNKLVAITTGMVG